MKLNFRTSSPSTTLREQVAFQETNAKKVGLSVSYIIYHLALKTLANSEYHFTKAQDASIPEKVDLFTFMKVCDDVLGIKPR